MNALLTNRTVLGFNNRAPQVNTSAMDLWKRDPQTGVFRETIATARQELLENAEEAARRGDMGRVASLLCESCALKTILRNFHE